PFTAGAFVRQIQESGAGVGPLGIAFSLDGNNVFVSGGAGRNNLYVFGKNGGDAGPPLATLDEPIYDMAFDSNGRLWAPTGGGPLVQLDPGTGAILDRLSDGVTLGLAADPNSTKLYVSTSTGVQVFDTIKRQFTPFSSQRVDGLALAPDG